MTIIRTAANEARRLTAGRMPRLAMVALVLIPTLYASLYLWANHDPYGELGKVQAALVVEDRPATTKQGKDVSVGEDVAADLIRDGSFDWQRVDADQARRGVRDGRYLFELRVPEDFSAAVASTAGFRPDRGELELTTNDANNYLSTTIAQQVISRVGRTISEKVGQQAANSFLLGFADLHDQLGRAATGASRLAGGASDLKAGAGRLGRGAGQLADGERQLVSGQEQLARGVTRAHDGADRLESGADDLSEGLGTLAGRTSSLPAQTRQLAAGARRVAAGNREVAGVGDEVATASGRATARFDDSRAAIARQLEDAGVPAEDRQAVLDRIDRLRAPLTDVNRMVQQTSTQLDRLADGSRRVASGAGDLSAASRPLTAGIEKADAGAAALARGASSLSDGLGTAQRGSARLETAQRQALSGADQLDSGAQRLQKGSGQLVRGAKQLSDKLASGVDSIPDLSSDQRSRTAAAIASPVEERNVSQATADSYGAGLAPFFLSIGAWVGTYVMFLLVRPLSNRAIAALQSPLKTALAGWLTPAVVAVLQVMVMLSVVTGLVGINVSQLAKVVVFLVVVAVCFVAIVHALNALLGAPGQLLGLVLLVLQLASSGGTFPWQTLPAPLQWLHHVLPMSYTVDGLRHLMYGAFGGDVARDVAVLLAYAVAAIAVSAIAARRRRVWTASRVAPELVL